MPQEEGIAEAPENQRPKIADRKQQIEISTHTNTPMTQFACCFFIYRDSDSPTHRFDLRVTTVHRSIYVIESYEHAAHACGAILFV